MKAHLKLDWTGPFTFFEYLDNAISREQIWKDRWPPEDGAVYLVSQCAWTGQPTDDSRPLYVGATTGESKRFRTRVGDLIADLFGFYGDETGHHSGGQSLWEWCDKERVSPFVLQLAWARTDCVRCAELMLFTKFQADGTGLLNKKHPPACDEHRNPA